tara:strand:+ start:6115 stop:6234 length:120 start_codon:yes stop_codon:yes gene_type:complete
MKTDMGKMIVASVIAGVVVWAITSSLSERSRKQPAGMLA